jgi:hypothetical protein
MASLQGTCEYGRLAANPCHDGLSAEPSRRQALCRAFPLGEDERQAEIRRSDCVVGGEAFARSMRPFGTSPGAARARTGRRACWHDLRRKGNGCDR